MKKTAILTGLIAFLSVTGYTQDCKVLLGAISVSYTGDCKGGKADGNGKATGLDSYEGQFKSGYPEGKGKYTWKTGDWFEGDWKKGAREGKGEMHYKRDLTEDSIIAGFWKKDQYLGRFEKPYIIINQSSKVGTVKVTKNVGYKEHDITIVVQSSTGGGMNISQKANVEDAPIASDIPKVKISGIDVQKGNFISQTDVDNSAKTAKSIFRTVEFPFRAIFRISDTHSVEIEFLEEGNYQIDVNILN